MDKRYIIKPYETIKELLEEGNISNKDFRMRCHLNIFQHLLLRAGIKNIDDELAFKLSILFEINLTFWMNLQRNYNKELLKELNK